MAETSRAGTGDSVCKNRRYRSSAGLIRQGNLVKRDNVLVTSLPLNFVDNSPNMHNTCFFSDCLLLSVTNGSIWIPHPAKYSEIFEKHNREVVKWKSFI